MTAEEAEAPAAAEGLTLALSGGGAINSDMGRDGVGRNFARAVGHLQK